MYRSPVTAIPSASLLTPITTPIASPIVRTSPITTTEYVPPAMPRTPIIPTKRTTVIKQTPVSVLPPKIVPVPVPVAPLASEEIVLENSVIAGSIYYRRMEGAMRLQGGSIWSEPSQFAGPITLKPGEAILLKGGQVYEGGLFVPHPYLVNVGILAQRTIGMSLSDVLYVLTNIGLTQVVLDPGFVIGNYVYFS